MLSKSVVRRLAHQREGKLKDHYQTCPCCDGEGAFQEDDPGDSEQYVVEPCDECDGDGKLRWGSWYINDHCVCEKCDEEKPCGNMDTESPEGCYLCFDCYVQRHAEDCDCGLWKKYEKECIE